MLFWFVLKLGSLVGALQNPKEFQIRLDPEDCQLIFISYWCWILNMPRYYCDYCDTYLTHDSPSVRKQHNAGYKHKANVRTYYQQFEEQQTQSLIDQRIREHLGQTAAFQQQVGVAFHQHLASLQSNPQRPRLPILPPPVLPNVAASQAPINSSGLPGVRPPILPRPITSAAGYGIAPSMPPMMGPPGTPSLSVQTNGLPGPPTLNPPNAVSGSLPTVSPGMYQNPAAVTSGGFDGYNISARATSPTVAGPPPAAAAAGSQDGYIFAQASEGNH